MQSLNETDEWQLAQWTAKHEGVTDLSLKNLVAIGFLPPTFNQHADGGQLLFLEAGRILDSLRGGKGSFTPVPDMPVTSVTAAEEQAYAEFARDYAENGQRLKSVMVGIQRFAVPAEQSNGEIRERVLLDVKATPVSNSGADLQKYLSTPTLEAANTLPEDALLLQVASWNSVGILGQPAQQIPNNYVIGLRNAGFAWQVQPQLEAAVPAQLTDAKLYAAAWPQPGMLKLLGARDLAQINAQAGPQPLPGAMPGVPQVWQQNRSKLSVVSWDQPTLQDVAARFPLGQAERPANVRLFVSDLNSSKLRDFVNGSGYIRARQVSSGNVHFLQNLIYQIGVPSEHAKALGEELIMGKFLDPLGGQYEATVTPDGLPQWRSTAWNGAAERLIGSVPPNFVAPPLGWFRGMTLEAALYPNEYLAKVEIEMKRDPAALAAEKEAAGKDQPALPIFNLPKFLQQDPPVDKAAPLAPPKPTPADPKVVPPSVMVPATKATPEVLPPPVPNPPVK
jgi:hypothetical protein